MDLTVLLGALLFPRSWRSFLKDLQVLAIAAVLLYLLVRFENWRYWYPVTLPVEFSTSVEQLNEAFGRRIQWASNGQYGGFLKARASTAEWQLSPVPVNPSRKTAKNAGKARHQVKQ